MERGWTRLAVLFLLVLVFLGGAAGVVGAVEPEKEKAPGIFDPRFDLGIWSIVVFVVLFWVLKRFAWGPMLQGLHRREQSIRDAIAEAQKTRGEAQALREQFQRQIDQANEQVRSMLDEARRDAQRARDEMIAGARGEIQSERDRLRREIEAARDQALQQLWNQTARLATLVSAKAIGRQLSEEDHRRLVDEALGEMRSLQTRRNGAGNRG
jgi:F-type H+-transporting ATPase subunit b